VPGLTPLGSPGRGGFGTVYKGERVPPVRRNLGFGERRRVVDVEHMFGARVVHSVGAKSRRPQVRSEPSALSVGASSVIGDDQSPSCRISGDDSSDHSIRTAHRERPFQR
jgi:hypothetical protein